MHRTHPQKNKKFFAIAGVLIAFCIGLLAIALFLPSLMRLFGPTITHKYDDRYVTDGKYVYYLDSRYQKVPGADLATFCSLYDPNATGRHKIYSYHGNIAGRDKNAVFAGTLRLEKISPKKARIFFGQYIMDGSLLYYRDGELLKDADIAAFEHIIGRYAHDGKHLYYGASLVEKADIATLDYITEKPLQGGPGVMADLVGNFRRIDDSRKDVEYLKDGKNVYFKGVSVPGADPDTFRILKVKGDQWRLTYAEDKHGYYFNGKPLPDTVKNTDEKLPPGSLKLLQADRNFGWAELFYAGTSIYAFNTQKEILEHVFTRDTAAPFTRLTHGVYADDRNVFFSAQKELWSRSKKGRYLIGREVYLQPLHGVLPGNFKKTATVQGPPSRKAGEIFEVDGVRYFHPRYMESGAALAFITEDGSLEPIALEKEFAHLTEYGSSFRRYGSFFFGIFVVLISLLAMFINRRLNAKRTIKPN